MMDLPDGWACAKFEDLLEFALGGDWGKAPDEKLDDSTLVRCIRASELRNWDDERGKSAALRRVKNVSLEKRCLKPGDILVEISGGGPDQAVGRTVLITPVVLNTHRSDPFVCTNFFRLCRPKKLLNAAFLNWYLTFFYRSGGTEDLQGGSNNLRNLRFPDFVAQNIPIPPTIEQRRIVEKIEAMFERIDKGVENLRAARSTLALYRQSLLKSAFEGRLTESWRAKNADKLEDPKTLLARIQKERNARYKAALDDWQTALTNWRDGGEEGKKPAKPKRHKTETNHPIFEVFKLSNLPKEWAAAQLVEIIDIVSGSTPKGIEECAGSKFPFFKVSDMNTHGNEKHLSASPIHASDEEAKQLNLTICRQGTIVFPKRGGAILTNKKRRLKMAGAFDLNTMGLVNNTDTIKDDFVWFWALSFNLSTIYDGSNVPQINNKNVEPLSFPICSPAEQTEINRILDARLDAADKMEAEIDAALARADALRQSILKRAFAGDLVPQDPTDEPAPTLLARIKAERAKAAKAKTAKLPKRKTAHGR